jgi:hypothetical protein
VIVVSSSPASAGAFLSDNLDPLKARLTFRLTLHSVSKRNNATTIVRNIKN